jgi:predicted metal-dependent hydrolase
MQIKLGDIAVDVLRKDIKNVHLSVYPPNGRVRLAAPTHMSPETIRVFAISKLSWIRQQQKKLRAQERETPREFLNRESHYVFGRRCLLKVEEHDAAPRVELRHSKLTMYVRPHASLETKQTVLDDWYRDQLRQAVTPLIEKWEPLLRVKVKRVFVQRMKTRWGSCNHTARTIRLNAELAKKPRDCLEYIVVHEMVHLLEPTHNARFVALMDKAMPKWEIHRAQLNRLPVRHAAWGY